MKITPLGFEKVNDFHMCYHYIIVHSQFGDIGIVWNDTFKKIKITRVLLPSSEHSMVRLIEKYYKNVKYGSTNIIDTLCKDIEKFLHGKQVEFSLNIINLSQLYDYQRRVLFMERKIPYGWVSTYGRIAKKIGTPGAARAVGTALARNPFPIIIPCHRTIRSDGLPGDFSGGVKLKRRLLELEGVRFDHRGRVIMERVW